LLSDWRNCLKIRQRCVAILFRSTLQRRTGNRYRLPYPDYPQPLRGFRVGLVALP
jgi:hypothetical protein